MQIHHLRSRPSILMRLRSSYARMRNRREPCMNERKKRTFLNEFLAVRDLQTLQWEAQIIIKRPRNDLWGEVAVLCTIYPTVESGLKTKWKQQVLFDDFNNAVRRICLKCYLNYFLLESRKMDHQIGLMTPPGIIWSRYRKTNINCTMSDKSSPKESIQKTPAQSVESSFARSLAHSLDRG